jgi:hypothetical protein
MTQVRADFADASGTVLARLRIGQRHDGRGNRHGVPQPQGQGPCGCRQVTIVVTFAGGNNYKLAGRGRAVLVRR